jgi:hypothetical protein
MVYAHPALRSEWMLHQHLKTKIAATIEKTGMHCASASPEFMIKNK